MTLLDLFFPKRCFGCGRIGVYFCTSCRSDIGIIEQSETICPVCEQPAIAGATHPRCQTRYTIDGLTSFFHYDGIIRKAVKALKYRYVSDLVQEFIALIPPVSFLFLTKQLSTKLLSSLVIPIPLHPSRQRHRGFNQAELLGRLLADRLEIPIRTRVLERVRKTVPQVEVKDREKRLKNMKGVFRIAEAASFADPRSAEGFGEARVATKAESEGRQFNNGAIFLFDDVFTTGATLRSAATALKHSGVKFVWGITMAR